MNLGKTKNANINYLAKVVYITEFHPHPDAEVNKLKCCTIDGFNIICGMESVPGAYIYFPAGCCLNPQLLSYANLYRHSHMNANPDESGMFEDNGRVKAIKLRGCISEGFILPIVILENFVLSVTNKELSYDLNVEFDCVQDGDKEFWINKKYIVSVNSERIKEHKRRKIKHDKVIPDQFRFHYDTVIIKKCPNVIKPTDRIHISSKVHGTSGISAYVLCHKKLTLGERIAKWLTGYEFNRYDYLYASRSVVKNREYNEKIKPGFYGVDIWEYADKIIRPHLDKGLTVYYEIIGFLPNGNYIQKSYDYGYEQPKPGEAFEYGKHFGIRVYRITMTNIDGKAHEYSPSEVQIWSYNNGLVPVKEYYYGRAMDLYPDLKITENWNEKLIDRLANDTTFNMECDSPECNNKVPHEGIVIKIDNMIPAAFKLKCFRFLNKEQRELDNGEANIEDNA